MNLIALQTIYVLPLFKRYFRQNFLISTLKNHNLLLNNKINKLAFFMLKIKYLNNLF